MLLKIMQYIYTMKPHQYQINFPIYCNGLSVGSLNLKINLFHTLLQLIISLINARSVYKSQSCL
jgi:hypothetical protein